MRSTTIARGYLRQIVVHAEAPGSGYDGHLRAPLIEATRETFNALEPGKDIFKRAKVTADSGFYSKTVVAAVEQGALS